jgi:hypothetical protein
VKWISELRPLPSQGKEVLRKKPGLREVKECVTR